MSSSDKLTKCGTCAFVVKGIREMAVPHRCHRYPETVVITSLGHWCGEYSPDDEHYREYAEMSHKRFQERQSVYHDISKGKVREWDEVGN